MSVLGNLLSVGVTLTFFGYYCGVEAYWRVRLSGGKKFHVLI